MLRRTIEYISRLCIISILLGLYFSNALKSIGIVCLAVTVLFHPDTIKNYRILIKNRLFVSIVIIAVVYILSVLYGGNFYYYWISSKNKLLYFFVPVALLNLPVKKNEISFYKYLFIACSIIQSLYSIGFLIHDPGLLKLYTLGQVLPTIEINHVEISWLISISILLLISDLKNISTVYLKIIVIIIGLWLFIFLHLFAVRTGIIAAYLFVVVYFIDTYLKNKAQRKYLALLPVLLGIILFASYKFSDSIRYKLNYTVYDIQQFRTGEKNFQFYSDSRRLQSIKIGVQLIKENPWIGCGIGNIEDKCVQIYKKSYPLIDSNNYYRPHSFYVYIICCFGIIIGAVVLLCFLYPVLYFAKMKNHLFLIIYCSIIAISAWDVIMGTLFGECLYLLLIGWGIKLSLHENITSQQQ